MAGIDRIRPSDDQPDQPDAEAARPSWSDRWRAAQQARMEAEETELRQLLAELDSDDRTAGEVDRPEREPGSPATGARLDDNRHRVDESRPPTTRDDGLPAPSFDYRESNRQAPDRATSEDQPDAFAEGSRSADEPTDVTADDSEVQVRDIAASSSATDAQRGWQRLSDPAEHVPWEHRLASFHAPTKEVQPERSADTPDTERVQVQRLEQSPDAAPERRAGVSDPADVVGQTSYRATTVAGTDAKVGPDSQGRHTEQASPRPWWVETGDRQPEPTSEPGTAGLRQPRESTTVGSEPSGFDRPDAEENAPTSWVSDAFKIPGGTRVAEGWSTFPAGGDRSVGRAADAPPARDDFGLIDGERWQQVPCAEQRPQRAYELYKSDTPLTEAESDALVRAKDKITEVLGEASVRELTADDVQEALQYVNPTGGGDNCVECSKAVDDILRGRPAAAGPSVDQSPYYADAAVSARAIDYLEDISAVNIERQMLEAGPGARGIVIGWKHHSPAHAYNVANIDGEVYWLDGQKDLMTEHDSHGSRSFDLYRTG